MLEVGSRVRVYPYDTDSLTEEQKLTIPEFYRQGGDFKGEGAEYYATGYVTSDDGDVFKIKRTDTGLTLTSLWSDIYKVEITLDAKGNLPNKGRSESFMYGGLREPEDSGDPDEPYEVYGGGKATDKIQKVGSAVYVIIGACLLGIAIYMR